MASSASGQDEPNRALWLATRAGKMKPSCPLGTTRCIPRARFPQKPYNISFIDQVCSVKMAEYWPRSFFARLWTSTSSPSINTQKKELGQYPAILTWGLWRGGPNPISHEIVFFKSQLKSHNPSLCCSNWNPIPIFLVPVPVHKIPFPSL